jgi:hypothetical protein
MPMSAGMIMTITFLITTAGVIIWYFAVAYKYKQTLNNFSYTRGANLDTLDKNKGAVDLTCESGAEICVWRANAICTGAINSQSNTEGGPEPISNGLNGNSAYGNFDINNTIDLTADMAGKANGKQSFTYNFDVTNKNFGGKMCPNTYNTKTGAGQRPQLIATYACIPKGSKCQSSKPPTPPIPPTPPSFQQVKGISGAVNVSVNNNNQICGSSSPSKFTVQCVDNYNGNSPKTYTIPGYATQLSLSDTGGLLGVGATNNVFSLNNFKTGSQWSNITSTVGQNISVSNRFGTSGTIAGSTLQDTYTWVMPKGSGGTNKLAVYGWNVLDSNANGDLCGIAYGNVQFLSASNYAGSPITVPTPTFTPTSVSINKTGKMCATSSKGDVWCTSSPINPVWNSVSTGQNFTNVSINDKGSVCANKNDGSVWCTS